MYPNINMLFLDSVVYCIAAAAAAAVLVAVNNALNLGGIWWRLTHAHTQTHELVDATYTQNVLQSLSGSDSEEKIAAIY